MAKSKRLSPETLTVAARWLPKKEMAQVNAQEITQAWLEEKIEFRKGLMKRDAWVGIPWFVFYCASLFIVGVTPPTIAIFGIGLVYFLYTIFTTGSYGQNRRRVKVYEDLLKDGF